MTHQPAVAFVLASVFLDALGIGIIIPVLPRLVGTLAGSPELQTVWYGAIMVSYGLMQFFSAPVIGAISDRIGRRPVLLAGIAGLGIMMIAPAVCDSLWLILLSRILAGTMSSNIVVAQAYIADVTPAGDRTAASAHRCHFWHRIHNSDPLSGDSWERATRACPFSLRARFACSTSSTASSCFLRAQCA